MHMNTTESSRTRSHKDTDSCPKKECSTTIPVARVKHVLVTDFVLIFKQQC